MEFRSYENDDSPVTPILESDELKRGDRFKLKRLKTKPAPLSTSPWLKELKPFKIPRIKSNGSLRVRHHESIKATEPPVSKPVDIFYRKSFTSVDMNEPIEWLHCAEMISPYLARAKKELTKPIVKTKKDHVVFRLLQLLTMNTTDFTKEEVYSVLYQISKLKIRFFSWDTEAMKMMFNIVTNKDVPGNHHNFGALKSGIKRLFDSWHLDRSNTTRLLMQARVFRPPCVPSRHTGSSRFVPGNTLTPRKAKKRQHQDDNSSADCQNRAHDHGDVRPSETPLSMEQASQRPHKG